MPSRNASAIFKATLVKGGYGRTRMDAAKVAYWLYESSWQQSLHWSCRFLLNLNRINKSELIFVSSIRYKANWGYYVWIQIPILMWIIYKKFYVEASYYLLSPPNNILVLQTTIMKNVVLNRAQEWNSWRKCIISWTRRWLRYIVGWEKI